MVARNNSKTSSNSAKTGAKTGSKTGSKTGAKTGAKRSKSAPRTRTQNGANSPSHLDKVRELLVGAELAGQEQKLSQVEDRFSKELRTLRSQLEKRIREGETRAQKQIDMLTQGIARQEAALAASEERILARLESIKTTASRRVAKLAEETTGRFKTLRTQVRSSSAKIREEAEAADLTVWNELSAEIEKIQADLTSRKSLSAVFRQVSQQLAAE